MHRLIVVDDSRATQSIIRRALLAAGFSAEGVHTVSTANEALDLAATLHPDLVITDWHMPTMTGLELLVRLRQSGHDQIRVGMVTTETSEVRLSEARAYGISFVVNKPFRDDELIRSVREALATPITMSLHDHAEDSRPPASDLVVRAATTLTRQSNWQATPMALTSFEACTHKVLLGVYSRSKDNAAIGLGLMDVDLVNIVGGLAAHVSIPEIRTALSDHKPSDTSISQAEHFLAMFADAIDPSGGTALSRSSLVSVKLDLLRKTLHNNRWGTAFTVTMPSLGGGALGLIRLGSGH